uniref:WD40 repeat containing protein n=1 Tax=Neospora caninum (strain Liverpool) TaxID=572307 RepID=A0A0F7ULQ2_NEOCL|nr:TPA: WD40 repeat containing protein [Neospora caninum Liverpool]
MALSVSNAAPSGTPDAASRETPSMGSPPADALAHNVDSAETHTIHPPEKDPHTEAAVATHVAVPVAEPEARRGGARDPPEEKPLGERSASEDGKADCFSTGVVQDRTTWQADSPPVRACRAVQWPSDAEERESGRDGGDCTPSQVSPMSLSRPRSFSKPFSLVGFAEAPFRAPLASSDEEDPPLSAPRTFSRCAAASPETVGTNRPRARLAVSAASPAEAVSFSGEAERQHAQRRWGRLPPRSRTQRSRERIGARRTGNENCLRGAIWSVDGSAFLTWSEDAVVRLFATPEEEMAEKTERTPFTLESWTCADEGELIFDCSWFPRLDWTQPRTYSYAVTSRDHPIHLYSGIDCSLLASYSCYNHLDEVAHAYSLLFHPTKPRLFAGGISGVRIFDLERPGRQVKDILFATRRAKQGQKGIISCMDFKQVGPGANQLFACGSYSPSVCVYTEEGGGRRSGVPYTTPTHCLLDKATSWGGVTQVKFVGEHLLVAGHRQDGTMRCWDLRRPSSPLSRLARETTQSSQKFAFDTCSFTDEDEGEITALVTGDELGQISFFSLSSWKCIYTHANDHRGGPSNPAVVATAFHPRRALLLTAAGSRRFHDFTASTSSSPSLSSAPSDVSDDETKELRCEDAPLRACSGEAPQGDDMYKPLRAHGFSEEEPARHHRKRRRKDKDEKTMWTEAVDDGGCAARIWQWGD